MSGNVCRNKTENFETKLENLLKQNYQRKMFEFEYATFLNFFT